MSTATALTTGLAIAQAAAPLIEKILEWAKNGMSTEEIQARLADPDDVGKELIERITTRRERGRDLLGRDPKPG